MSPDEIPTYEKLKIVAQTFVELQQAREEADYETAHVWRNTDAYFHVAKAEAAITTWRAIRETDLAQDYLYDLLDTRRR